jgi:hypothetical protein
MTLTNLPAIQAIPGVIQNPFNTTAYLTSLITAADRAVKTWLKRDIEQNIYTEYHSGGRHVDIVLNQFPVINDSNLAVYVDPNGAWGQGPNAFGTGTLQVLGKDYGLVLDNAPQGTSPSGNPVSNRGLLRCLAGSGIGFGGLWYPGTGLYPGKLAAQQLPWWPWGYGNIKVIYSAGYASNNLPQDIVYAVNSLVMFMLRNQPTGMVLSGEGLGAYSYSLLQAAAGGDPPILGDIVRTLAPFRESSWGNN